MQGSVDNFDRQSRALARNDGIKGLPVQQIGQCIRYRMDATRTPGGAFANTARSDVQAKSG